MSRKLICVCLTNVFFKASVEQNLLFTIMGQILTFKVFGCAGRLPYDKQINGLI